MAKTTKKTPVKSAPGQNEGLPGLGVRLKHARLLAELTLKQVAAQAGCSESLISKLEHDAASPSLAMLHRLALALNTNISELTAETWDHEDPVQTASRRSRTRFVKRNKEGGIELERLTPSRKGMLLQGNIHIIAPGTLSDGLIEHQGEEMGYVLNGTIELTIGEKTYSLSAGDSFHFPSHLPHGYHNTGDEETRVLWVNTPVTF